MLNTSSWKLVKHFLRFLVFLCVGVHITTQTTTVPAMNITAKELTDSNFGVVGVK